MLTEVAADSLYWHGAPEAITTIEGCLRREGLARLPSQD